jgi:hypothetical protein
MMESTFLARTMAALAIMSTLRSQCAKVSTGSIARCPLRANEEMATLPVSAPKKEITMSDTTYKVLAYDVISPENGVPARRVSKVFFYINVEVIDESLIENC